MKCYSPLRCYLLAVCFRRQYTLPFNKDVDEKRKTDKLGQYWLPLTKCVYGASIHIFAGLFRGLVIALWIMFLYLLRKMSRVGCILSEDNISSSGFVLYCRAPPAALVSRFLNPCSFCVRRFVGATMSSLFTPPN